MRRQDRKQPVKAAPWPTFTKEQVEFLEQLYPVRLLGEREDVDAYRHHCGAAALVQLMRAQCPDLRKAIDLDYDGEEDLTPEIVQAAIERQRGQRGE